MWRRACIEEAGGWQHDTLTEDLDLSYRAQLLGWRFVFLPGEIAPAELPVEMAAFKSQQHRWAKGSIETARKLLPRILGSHLPLSTKLEAGAHLLANVGYLLMLVVALLVVPALWLRRGLAPWSVALVDLPIFALSTLSVVGFYCVAHTQAAGTRRGLLRRVPFLMAVGVGLTINNSRAVLEALCGRRSTFLRTPKYALRSRRELAARRYRGRPTRDTWIELCFAAWFALAASAAALEGLWGGVPCLVFFEIGFGYTALTTIAQAAWHRPLASAA
jgi:hypothetical protein